LTPTDRLERSEKLILGDAEFFEDLGGSGMRILLDGGETEMFDADLIVLEFGCLLGGSPQKGLKSGGNHCTSRGDARARDLGEPGDFRLESFGEARGLSTEFFD